MKSWVKYIYLFACCTVMLSSCILEEEVLDAADSCETTVELTLSYSDGSPMSRDVSPDDDENLDYTTVEQKASFVQLLCQTSHHSPYSHRYTKPYRSSRGQ